MFSYQEFPMTHIHISRSKTDNTQNGEMYIIYKSKMFSYQEFHNAPINTFLETRQIIRWMDEKWYERLTVTSQLSLW